MTAKLGTVQFIWCDDARTGDGTESSPMRRIEQLYLSDGSLIAYFDHKDDHVIFTPSAFRKFLAAAGIDNYQPIVG